MIDAYDAAIVDRRTDGKVKIVKKHERVGSFVNQLMGFFLLIAEL